MEIFSGQNFSFSSFLSVETLIKWVNFGDGSLPTVPKVLESSNGNYCSFETSTSFPIRAVFSRSWFLIGLAHKQ